ncbi:hypothetical protein Tco_1023143 [Tanacetum coccineum]
MWTSFGTPNTSTKLATTDPNNIPSNERDDGSVNVIQSAKSNGMGHVPYANLLNGEPIKKAVNFHTLIVQPGKKVVYPAVENYFKNAWSRFGLVRTMMNSNGIFFFKFNSNTDLKSIPVWVKLHDVLITTFTKDELSVIATKLDNPLILDSYTASMCMETWCRSSFARTIIDFRADIELNDTLVVEVPKLEGVGMQDLPASYAYLFVFFFVRVLPTKNRNAQTSLKASQNVSYKVSISTKSSGTSTFETSSSKGGTKHAKVNNSKDDKNLPTSSSKDVLNTFNKYDLLSNEFDTFFEECKDDANAILDRVGIKDGKKMVTREVDAVMWKMMERELPIVGQNVDSDEEG